MTIEYIKGRFKSYYRNYSVRRKKSEDLGLKGDSRFLLRLPLTMRELLMNYAPL